MGSEALEKQQEDLKKRQEAVKYRLRKLSARQSEITKQSSSIRESIILKYQEMRDVLDEDLRTTLSHLEMEERAAVSALDGFMETNCSLIQEIEQELDRLTLAMEQIQLQPQTMSFFSNTELEDIEDRVLETLTLTDPSHVTLDQAKSEQIQNLTHNLLQLIQSQTPLIKKLLHSYSTEVHLNPDSAHPKLRLSSGGDSVSYSDTWQDIPDHPTRFDSTLYVLSTQAFSYGRHYIELDVSGKSYWELGVTYPTIPRKGPSEACWLGRGEESWCMEYFDGEYTAWHGGIPHQLPVLKRYSHIGVLCSFPAGQVMFLEVGKMTPLFSFCVGTFTDSLHLALCPGHDHNGTNTKPIVICNAPSPTSDL
ncbi:probable E3 ubiquitin-protein ligase TRIML1 [Periophthalmus magnuspinnatus]|nr:probable E3 ubiquitin-protein ligase TRIML1 [Periophthalmus magnuspinnatus]